MKSIVWVVAICLVLAFLVSPATAKPKASPWTNWIGICTNVPPVCIVVPVPPSGQGVIPGNPGGVSGSKRGR